MLFLFNTEIIFKIGSRSTKMAGIRSNYSESSNSADMWCYRPTFGGKRVVVIMGKVFGFRKPGEH